MPEPTENATPVEDLSYREAIAEVEAIVDRLDSSAVDVDELAGSVSRGLALLHRCRQRLDDVTAEVDQLVASEEAEPQ